MSVRTYLDSRVDSVPMAVGLALGDAAALGLFVLIGEVSHGNRPFENPEMVIGTLAPFLLAWLVVAGVGGLYTSDALLSPRRAVSWALPAWIFAGLLGHALRATPLFRGGTALSFIVVSLVAGGALLLGWRLVASVATAGK